MARVSVLNEILEFVTIITDFFYHIEYHVQYTGEYFTRIRALPPPGKNSDFGNFWQNMGRKYLDFA